MVYNRIKRHHRLYVPFVLIPLAHLCFSEEKSLFLPALRTFCLYENAATRAAPQGIPAKASD